MLKNSPPYLTPMGNNITFRVVLEVIGKPKEHVEKAIRSYLDNLKQDKKYQLIREEIADVKQQDKAELWSTFAELELKTTKIENLTSFCFEYMPSLIEVVEPQEFTFDDGSLSQFLNDLQAKLHQIDMIAKEVKVERDILMHNMTALLKNYVLVLLSKDNLTSEQLSKLTGVEKSKLEDYLDRMIDEGKIDLKGELYFRTEKKKHE